MIKKIKQKIIIAYNWVKGKLIYFLIGGIAIASTPAFLPDDPTTTGELIQENGIEIVLQGKTANERAFIKSHELSKVQFNDIPFIKDDLEIKIIGDIQAIEINGNHGIELFATAYKNGKQLGFGKDGTIDIERFRIYNPPVLVDDPNGEIIREWTDEITKETKQRKLKYDPTQAIKNSLAHTIGLVAKDGKDIVKGKVGNTTSTFYPSLDGESGASDASSWYTAHDKTTGNDWENGDAVNTTDTEHSCITKISPRGITRLFFFFDTSAIDTDDIDSAVLSLYQTNSWGNTGSDYIAITEATPTSDTALVAGDYDQVNSTEISDTYVYPNNGSLNAYRDYTFNSTGEGLIDKTGYSIFSQRTSFDIARSAPTGDRGMNTRSSDYTGTSSDPKLVVVHSAAEVRNRLIITQ